MLLCYECNILEHNDNCKRYNESFASQLYLFLFFQNNFHLLKLIFKQHLPYFVVVIVHSLFEVLRMSSSLKNRLPFIFICKVAESKIYTIKRTLNQFQSCIGQIIAGGFYTVSRCIIVILFSVSIRCDYLLRVQNNTLHNSIRLVITYQLSFFSLLIKIL